MIIKQVNFAPSLYSLNPEPPVLRCFSPCEALSHYLRQLYGLIFVGLYCVTYAVNPTTG